jgi:hypothetical protein
MSDALDFIVIFLMSTLDGRVAVLSLNLKWYADGEIAL